jgi:plastocyanin
MRDVAALALACALLSTFAPVPLRAAPGATVKVSISNYTFKPATLTVAPGTTVVWTNQDDDPHTVTADNGSFDSKGLGQSDTYRRTFTKPGRYAYHCAAHPFMKGTIIVTNGGSR